MKTKTIKTLLNKKLKKKSFAKAYKEMARLVEVGLNIAKLREKTGLTQGQLAKKLGTTQSVISRIENGNQNVSLALLTKIAHVLKCELTVKFKPIYTEI